jgi:nucleoside-diphosphate-sugar epimerase
MKIALFGGTGGCGSAFLEHALASNYSIVLQARTPSKVAISHENLKVVKGDGTVADDVLNACEGCDIVVSCAGSSRIMESLATNVVEACKAHNIQRCYFITSLGMGGSSPMVRFVLGCIVSWENIYDCEKADKIILDAGFTAIRPTELSDKGEPTGKYNATSETGMGMGALHKGDVGLFICDEIGKNEWNGKAVQLYKAK